MQLRTKQLKQFKPLVLHRLNVMNGLNAQRLMAG